VEAITKQGQRTIDSKEVLRSGDRLALHVEVSQPAYVTVGLLSAKGVRTILFPKKENELLSAGTEHRIPPAGQWFRLDQDTGREDIFVYASKKPLKSNETLALLQKDGQKVRGAAPSAAPSSPKKPTKQKKPVKPAQPQDEGGPEALSSDTRGIDVVGSEEKQAEDGVTRMHFPIRHRR
jgi:hypothetical protein